MSKVIVLTGGATGMGAATVTRLVAADCEVHVLDVNPPEATEVRFHKCDLGSPSEIDVTLANLPISLDGLINVAGIATADPPEQTLAVNFLGLRYLTEACLPRISEGGSVVNVASTAGWDWRKREAVVRELLATPDFAAGLDWLRANQAEWTDNPYKFSKQCAAAYTYRAAGLALNRRVRVNCVNPGAVETRLTPQFRELVGPALYDWGVEQIGRQGTPDDVAEVIEFLSIGHCGWLNGVEIPVDGGYLAGLTGGWVNPDESPA
jgi:NAD(P)-dependent dehydrogenase (short-subunit alcohol dehydrogenase family)